MITAPVGHQCPECVSEAQRAFKASGAGPQEIRSMSSGTPITIGLIVLLVAGYALQVATGSPVSAGFQAGGTITDAGFAHPLLIGVQGEYYRLITAIFLHAGVLHLAMNAYGLYLFGGFVERTYGRVQLVALFFVTGFLASVTSYALSSVDSGGSLGASGAVFGLGGVFIAYAYRRRNTQYGRAMFRSAMTWLLINAVFSFSVEGIDWRAHAGGVAAGFIAGYLLEVESEKYSRRTVAIGVLTGMVVVGVATTLWKTNQIQQVFASLALN